MVKLHPNFDLPTPETLARYYRPSLHIEEFENGSSSLSLILHQKGRRYPRRSFEFVITHKWIFQNTKVTRKSKNIAFEQLPAVVDFDKFLNAVVQSLPEKFKKQIVAQKILTPDLF